VIWSDALLLGSITEVAVTVTCCGPLRLAVGGVYEIVDPVVALIEPGPFNLHVTPGFAVAFDTFAVIPTVWP
jgi:hypothetical protein